jgi:hypothetical protein
MEGIVKGGSNVRHFQTQAFPSWQSGGAFGRAAQSEAALVACAARPKADVSGADGKAVIGDGILVLGGANV